MAASHVVQIQRRLDTITRSHVTTYVGGARGSGCHKVSLWRSQYKIEEDGVSAALDLPRWNRQG